MRPPSVDTLARRLSEQFDLPHPLLVDAARTALGAGDPDSAAAEARAIERTLLGPVVNASGVLLHTNLGRAPVAYADPGRYANLELDLTTGRRSDRNDRVGPLVARACGAGAALVVNNGAAAVALVLAALAPGRGVAVSRGELVEIGGGFRVPEVMEQSGARLVEVGTTNRTARADYVRASESHDDLALILKVHPSNYRITGFTASVPVAELIGLGPPVVVDLGSGLLDQACPWLPAGPPEWLADEPGVAQTLAAGAALVTFSGDKLLGGPQAGLIAGRADLVDRCARHPLYRAFRPGHLVLAALQETMLAYLRRDADAIPFWRMACLTVPQLRARASTIVAAAMTDAAVVDTAAVAGAGSLPGRELPSAGVAVGGDHAAALRAKDPPIVARVRGGRTWLDLRTVEAADDEHLAKSLASLDPTAAG